MNRKLLLCGVLLLCALLCLAACGGQQPVSDDDPLPEIPTEPIHIGSGIGDSPFVGSFSCSWSGLYASGTGGEGWQGAVSRFQCAADGSFTLLFDSMDEQIGAVTVSGSVSVSDDTATCSVESRSAEGYLGEELAEFQLVLVSENELRYVGEQQGMAYAGDIYSREG